MSYTRKKAVDEARTRDLHLGKVALYQLSYYRTVRGKCGRRDLNSYASRHRNLNPARLPFRHARMRLSGKRMTHRRFELRTP